MLEQMMRRITAVKYTGVRRPTESPFWDTIRATSPLVIMPTPIFKLSLKLNLQIFAMRPQPMIFVIKATRTNPIEKMIIPASILSMLVFRPILAKKTGPKSM